MCNTNNDDVIYNPTVQQLHDAFLDNGCEVWYVNQDGYHRQSFGNLTISLALVKSIYIKRKPKIIAKYGDFEFTQEELPQESVSDDKVYFYIHQGTYVFESYWSHHSADYDRAANKNVFLTKQAAKKWQQMLLSFQNNLLNSVCT